MYHLNGRNIHCNINLILTEYVASNSFDTQGPTFTLEPSFRLEFTNTAGSRADCTARGNPSPHVEWLDVDNNAVTTIQSVSYFSTSILPLYQFFYLKNIYLCVCPHMDSETLSNSKFKRNTSIIRNQSFLRNSIQKYIS